MKIKGTALVDAETLNAYFHDSDTFATRLEISIVEVSDSHAVARMPLTEMHRNGMGNAHGGAIYSLVDMAFAAVAHASGQFFVTAQSSINFLEAGRTGPLEAVATKVRCGKTLGVYEVRVTDIGGTLVAIASMMGYNTKIPIDALQNHRKAKEDA